ncbi:SARP family transcriptional regulator [Actinokineospora fastidiosa]|uniref:SARP family transcriptional regulator n=2 Tax=Actinokineospora fastidiosa TaxID=1816 RepID=A0A918LGE3_9PSEU|nr:SARP family transcriptional regulator [Actinokineospora fastidiosa]
MLGPLEAWHQGGQVHLGDPQQRLVLVVLLLHANRPVSTERLTEIVWGDPDRRGLVRSYINRLRKALREAADVSIETTPSGYTLCVDEDLLDIHRFDRLRAEAAEADDPRRAIALLREAVDLWRGGFLEDIDTDRVGGTEVYSPRETYLDAVGDLAELELTAGDHRSARDRLRRVVSAHPDKQRHATLLMRALLACGDQVGAIRVFQSAAAALAEWGVEPGPQLRKLAALAERGEPASRLPSRPGGFTGRDAEFAVIDAAAAGERRAVWVSGAPGVGKTGLAIEAAHRLRARFPDGQFLVRLNGYTPNVPATTVADALTQLLTELGVPPEQIPATDGRKAALYQSTLFGTRTLVVLDNARSPDQVRPLLPETAGCLAIVTSRRMGDPDTGEHLRLSPLPPDDAIALFTGLNEPHRVRGRGDEVAGVVKRCGYLPMPIKVAAALFRRHIRWSVDHLLRLLEESGPWRAGGDEDGAAAVRVSYQQLADPQRELFRLFGHLPGRDVDVAGAAALAGRDVAWARAVLDDLHEVCLLEEIATDRYQMLDPLKEFAAAQPLPASPTERADALRRLSDYYLVTLERAVGTGYPFDRALQPVSGRSCPVAPVFESADGALAWIAAERDNLVAAIHHAAAHGLPQHAWRLAVLVWRHFNTTSQLEDWTTTMELARDIVSSDPGDDCGQAHVLLRLATAHNRLGRLAEARGLAEQALPRWTRIGDVVGEAATLCALGVPMMELGDHDDAIGHFAAALAKYEQIGDLRGQAHALSMLGNLNELRGNLAVALRQHESAVPMLREVDHVQGLAHALNNLGSVQQRLGLHTEALASHTEAYERAREVGDDCVAAYALNYIGNVYRQLGRLTDAKLHHDRAREAAAELSDADLRTQLYRDRGATAAAGGDHADAFRAYHAALDLASSTGNRTHQAYANRGIAHTLHALGNHPDAVAHWQAAETGFAELGQPEAEEIRAERAAMTCACR